MLLTASFSTNSTSSSSTLEPSPTNQMLLPPSANNLRPPSRASSILDSPMLARVERAHLRLEASSQQQLQQQKQQQHNGSRNGSATTMMNGEDSLERQILDPKKDVPWHQVWTHMKRLSHASKVNSTSTLTAQKTDVGPGKCLLFPDKTASLKDSLYAQQVYFRPDMQSLLAGRIPVASMTGPIKRGLLWQQRDRLFSRWKERYFVLTRDYLHCFKRASGSANERASDMGQFIFKVKLVDVEKVEWLNRRSYSVIGLLLGREGRVLLRCEDGLEDWFELLEECTLTSKERRRALKIAQGPRSRASLAAPVSHASLQTHHFGLGSTYSSVLEDWLMTNGSGAVSGRHKMGAGCISATNPFLFSDSVPDLSALNNDNHNHHHSGISTNHSTPQKIPYSSAVSNGNNSRYSNGYSSQNSSFSNCTGLYGSPRRFFINNSFNSNQVVDEEVEDDEVELRHPHKYRNNNSENDNELDGDWLYRKPRSPTDMRHSVQPLLPTTNSNSSKSNNTTTDLDYSAHDSGIDTTQSSHRHRPSSYRHVNHTNQDNLLKGSRYSVQDRILTIRNEEDRYAHNKTGNGLNNNDQCCKHNGNPSESYTPKNTPTKCNPTHAHHSNGRNNNDTLNGNFPNGPAIFRHQHPALAAIINEV